MKRTHEDFELAVKSREAGPVALQPLGTTSHILSVLALLVLMCSSCGRSVPIPLQSSTGAVVDSSGDIPRYLLTMSPTMFVGQWSTVAHFVSRPTSAIPMDLKGVIDLRFEAQGETSLDVFLESVLVSGEAGGKPMKLGPVSSNDKQYTMAFETPLSTITFSEQGPALGVPNSQNPLSRQGYHLIHSTVFSIPTVPTTPVGVGATWRASRVIPRSSDAVPELTGEIVFTLTEVSPCTGDSNEMCAMIRSRVDTGYRDELHKNGTPVKVRYTLDGQSQIRVGGGVLKTKIDMTMELELKGMRLDLDGSVTTQQP